MNTTPMSIENSLCPHLTNESISTCSTNGTIWYCVECMWAVSTILPCIDLKVSRCAHDIELTSPDDDEARIRDADLSFPLCVKLYFDTDEYLILDGCHRYLKAQRLGNEFVVCVAIPDELLATCQIPDLEQ